MKFKRKVLEMNENELKFVLRNLENRNFQNLTKTDLQEELIHWLAFFKKL